MKEDFNKLRLKHHGDPVMMEEILQRECRYKTASKLPDTLRNQDFRFPSLAVAEMATSDAVAGIHASMSPDGSTVLDMTCGLGIDSFHFASKAGRVTAVELDNKAYLTAVHNVEALGLGNVRIVEGDSITFINSCQEHFDVIFVDPARRDSAGRHFALRDCSPDIIPALPTILSHCSTLIVKASPMIDIKAAVNELRRDCAVTVIGTTKECKEVVFIINATSPETVTPKITAIEAKTVNGTEFGFIPGLAEEAEQIFLTPRPGMYLYEPYPAVMKGGGMKVIPERYNVGRLHPNTNLFTSEEQVDVFPGECFEIEEVLPFSKQTVKSIAKSHPTINVATRNFPLTAPQLVTKLKVKEGGDKMLFGTTTNDGTKILLITTMGKCL